MEAGQGTEVDLGSEVIFGGDNVITNDVLFEIGTYVKGQILAIIKTLSGVGSSKVGNTGNATFTAASVAMNDKAKEGVYVLTWTAATAYNVEDPDGNDIGAGDIAAGFASVQIDFGITVGGVAMIAGDIQYVTVTLDSSRYGTLVADAVDGSEVPQIICATDKVLAAAGYNAVAAGEFQLEGVQAVMTALTVAVTITEAMINELNKKRVYLKRR